MGAHAGRVDGRPPHRLRAAPDQGAHHLQLLGSTGCRFTVSMSSTNARRRCAAGTCGAGSERGNGTVSAGALDAGCGDRVLTRRISRGGYPTCGRRPGARRQRGRRPFGCGVRCPGQGHMPRRAAIRGLLTTLGSPPSIRHPRGSQPSVGYPEGRILQGVPRTAIRPDVFCNQQIPTRNVQLTVRGGVQCYSLDLSRITARRHTHDS